MLTSFFTCTLSVLRHVQTGTLIAGILVVTGTTCCSVVAWGQTPCEGGYADGFPCDRMTLLSSMSNAELNGTGANDVWGWTDPVTGVEYALVGERQGLAIVDLSDPTAPFLAAFMPTQTISSTWRDMKVYDDHAYVVSEANGHGLQILDLNQLRELSQFPATLEPTNWLDTFSDAHNVVIDEGSGLLYAVGTNLAGGGIVAFDLTDPASPILVGDYSEAGYTHDAQGVVYNGPDSDFAGKSIIFGANANKLAILDATDPSDIATVSITNYDYSYTHQCWLTEDHKYLLLGDELDEQNQGINTRTLIFDVQDLSDPVLIGEHFSDLTAIDHNQYVIGNLLFQANYSAGLRMLSLTDVAAGELTEIGYFDVDPMTDAAQCTGSWSTYPYFESGTVVVTSIEDGIYVVRPKFIDVEVVNPSICQGEDLFVFIELLSGLLPPFELSIPNLPAGANVENFQFELDEPGSFVCTVTGLTEWTGDQSLTVQVDSPLNQVRESFEFSLEPSTIWYADADGDGYGDTAVTTLACSEPVGYTSDATDCNDASAVVYPGAPGTEQGLDNNCDGFITGNEEVGCPGDFNSDGVISVADLLIYLGEFGCEENCTADFDLDGLVNIGDLLGFLSVFGAPCPS
ncbi:MAG: choice-of-anchor B family protein [Bacteroidota bacterium]|nr:choice-of-anchor B family protein [Bacteroidota bacterium]